MENKPEKKETQNSGTEEVTLEKTDEKDVYAAPQWKLIWWRFTQHKVAVTAGVFLIIAYLVAIFAPFFSPHNPHQRNVNYQQAPPQRIMFSDGENISLRPHTYPLERELDPETYELTFTEDTANPVPIQFFVRGEEYELFGLIESDLRLFGTGREDIPFHIFGTDRLGRDMLSRIIYGARISLSIAVLGVLISTVLGVTIGGIAGYFGGKVDMFIQRAIELVRSFPDIPLWMALSAALPSQWSPVRVYFAIVIILSLIQWTSLARIVRGRFLSLREEEFVIAARLMGRSNLKIIFIHMIPTFLSHIIAHLTLSIPGMIIAETSLSFLGVGLQPPVISWGVLLQQAQNLHAIVIAPWLMIPGVFVVITVLAFNFLGDGIRDAADPYDN